MIHIDFETRARVTRKVQEEMVRKHKIIDPRVHTGIVEIVLEEIEAERKRIMNLVENLLGVKV